MNRKKIIKVMSIAALAPSIIIENAYATSSWEINREECIGCEACVLEAPDCITLDEEDHKAKFLNEHASGAPKFHYGCGYYKQMFEAQAVCPLNLIKEIGK
ncbi:MAG: hypothetical protein Kow0037_13450 [Calditrichia bacterium]